MMAARHVIMILLITTYEASSRSGMDSEARAKALRSGKTGLRIINGTNVDPPYKYPSIVGLYYNGCGTPECAGRPGYYFCAGSIYNKHWVVSAAHCYPPIKPPVISHIYAIAGIHDVRKPEPWTQNVSVVEIIVHEQYQKGGEYNMVNDIALYRVNPPFKFSDKVAPMNIADFNFQPPGDYNTTAIAVGWGNQEEPAPQNTVLQEVQIPLITNSRCQRFYGWYNLRDRNRSTVVNQGMICAAAEEGGLGACQGDSGAPLFIYNEPDDTYTQIGVVSDSSDCGDKNFPGLYTRLGYFTAWIENQIQLCDPRKAE